MTERFKQALDYVIQNEGDTYIDNPMDSGGPTKFGVTQIMYSKFLGREVSGQDIEALTFEKVSPFYENFYWSPVRGDQISDSPKATALFDTAVLYGPARANSMAQKISNSKVDGIMGENSLHAVNLVQPEIFILKLYIQIRDRIDEVIKLNRKNEIFRKGWLKRADRLLTTI